MKLSMLPDILVGITAIGGCFAMLGAVFRGSFWGILRTLLYNMSPVVAYYILTRQMGHNQWVVFFIVYFLWGIIVVPMFRKQ